MPTPSAQIDTRHQLEQILEQRILVLDGAMGTMIQRLGLGEADFRGERFANHPHDLKGNNDLLVLTQPEAIRRLHAAFLEAGADMIETNTFNGTSISQADYDTGALAYEINRTAARLAREADSSAILDAIALGQSMTVSNPDESGDWLYVRDAVKALLTAWQAQGVKQRIYNIAGGVHSIREVVGIAAKYRPGHHVTLVEGGSSASPYPDSYDDRMARQELGWQPDYSIESAVREHLEIVGGGSR